MTGQFALDPVQTYGEQLGLPGPVMLVQVPGVGELQELHEPAQVVLQQNPSTQNPDAH